MTWKITGHNPTIGDEVEFVVESERGTLATMKMKLPEVLKWMESVMPIVNEHLKNQGKKTFQLPAKSVTSSNILEPGKILISIQTDLGMEYHFQCPVELVPKFLEQVNEAEAQAARMSRATKQ